MPSPSGISEMSLASMTWPIVAVPVSRIGRRRDDDAFLDAAGRQRDVDDDAIADAHA